MLFHIEHRTTYRYGGPVFLEPHRFRFLPRSCPSQRVQAFRLDISPQPQARSDELDAEGNSVTHAWFTDTTPVLAVQATVDVVTLRTNPFDFLPSPGGTILPMTYSPSLRPFLAPYCKRETTSGTVATLARKLVTETNKEVMQFLMRLVEKLHREVRYVRREDGPPRPPAETLVIGEGSCRDTALLFMDACRCVGLAARFVSGYREGDPANPQHDLHAWAEVFIPDGGWRGYDPSHGLAVADQYVAVTASVHAAGASPVTGAFRGPAPRVVMETNLSIRTDSTSAK